jgi:opacity protein-like surface antigen
LEIPVISRWLIVIGVAAAAAAIPSTAVAQEGRWFAGGLGGVTFVTDPGGAIAAQAGARIGSGLFVIGEVGRFSTVMPREIRDLVDEALEAAEVPVTFEISAPAIYVFGGVRWTRAGGRTAPFIEGGIGVAHATVKLSRVEILGVDFSALARELIENEIGGDLSTTNALIAVGGGVTRRIGSSATLDAGYRYTRIQTGEPNPDVSLIYVAVKFGR